jgi:hypothetical protein
VPERAPQGAENNSRSAWRHLFKTLPIGFDDYTEWAGVFTTDGGSAFTMSRTNDAEDVVGRSTILLGYSRHGNRCGLLLDLSQFRGRTPVFRISSSLSVDASLKQL